MSPAPLISINIPCYQQLRYAQGVVAAILNQRVEDFELTLLDDGASDEYRDYALSLRDPRVRYHRNPARLGAMRNMFAAIKSGRGKYTLAFHEDDVLGTHYIESAIDILERHPACGFVAGELRSFAVEPSPHELSTRWDGNTYDELPGAIDYLKQIFLGVEPMFGSVVYRATALAGVEPQHDRFATLVDRPFLLDILAKWSAAIVRAPLVWYRQHPRAEDRRHSAMTARHAIALFERYRAVWPRAWNDADAALFFGYSEPWLRELYGLCDRPSRPSLTRFVFDAWRRGLVRARLRGPLGARQILGAVLRPALAP
jgi:glycosyltransferase involved in cell wall biosynthesis